MNKDITLLGEEDQEVIQSFEKKVKDLPLKDRLKAAVLFELFEEKLFLYNENMKFNDLEHQNYDDKIAELTDCQDKII